MKTGNLSRFECVLLVRTAQFFFFLIWLASKHLTVQRLQSEVAFTLCSGCICDKPSNLHVSGVRLQAAHDHADGRGQQVGDVPQHHAWRPCSGQDVVHKTQKGFWGEKHRRTVVFWRRERIHPPATVLVSCPEQLGLGLNGRCVCVSSKWQHTILFMMQRHTRAPPISPSLLLPSSMQQTPPARTSCWVTMLRGYWSLDGS